MGIPNIDAQSINSAYQTHLAHKKNVIFVGVSAVGIGLLTKHVLGKRTLPVSTGGEMFLTFFLTSVSSFVGDKIALDMGL